MKKVTFHGRWTENEKAKFLQAISIKNLSWKEISNIIGTRSASQCRSHNQKLNKSLKKRIKVEPVSKIDQKIKVKLEPFSEYNQDSKVKIEPSIENVQQYCKFASKMIQCELIDCSTSELLVPVLLNPKSLSTTQTLDIKDDPSEIPDFFEEFLEPLDDYTYF